jgi:AcrR family transcriptional regulator
MNVKEGASPAPGRQTERSDATRGALLAAARELFTEQGYSSVSTEEIVRAAGVTRGALYHHFRDKQDLFRAVFEVIEQEMAERVATAALAETDPWAQQRLATGAFLDNCLDPAVQRIALTDAPSVLGLAEWREIEERYGLALIQAAVQNLMDQDLIERQPVEPLAHLMLGAFTEAGLLIARAADREAARAEVGESIERLMQGLRKT